MNIEFKGAGKVNPTGHYNQLVAALDVENSNGNPVNVLTKTGTFSVDNSFIYTFPANSISVLRIGRLIRK